MKNHLRCIESLMVACLTTAASPSVYGIVAVPSIQLSAAAPGDVTFDIANVAGFSGSITFENPSGNSPWTYAGTGVAPIVSFDIVTPDGICSSADGTTYLLNQGYSGAASATWSTTGIQSIDVQFVFDDPQYLYIYNTPGLPGDFTFNLGGSSSPPSGNLDPVPDECQTWLLLASACAALGGHQMLNRRNLKPA